MHDNLLDTNRDGSLKSPWQQPESETIDWQEEYAGELFDTVIVGGGITGITAALILQQNGKKCIIAEAHNIGFGTTGGTSAHINTFADTTYAEAESAFGEEGARLFAEAIGEGFSIISDNVTQYGIDCDFETKDGYLYAENEDEQKELKQIYESAVKYNVAVNFSKTVPIPVPYKEALTFPGQAQFHPIKYLQGLAGGYLSMGGVVIEDFRVEKISRNGEHYEAVDSNGRTINAKSVFYATHVPPGINAFSFRCAPYRSYVLGVTLRDDKYPDALVYDMQDPYHYFRTHVIDGKKCLIVGGNDHKTGHGDPSEAFERLEHYVKAWFEVNEILFRWSSQYYVPVDGLPYIGLMPGEEGIYCATGYNGNGMMLGSIAGKIVADSILGRQNEYSEVFKPSRLKPLVGFKEFVKENADVAYQFVTSQFSGEEIDSIKHIPAGTGALVKLHDRQLAIFKAEDGAIHALDPVCTHAGCVVGWNSEEKSWDCPCHGARYDINGNVLNGPTQKNLQKVSVQ